MKKFLAVFAFVFPLSTNAQTIDFAVEAVDFFGDTTVEIVDFFADETWEVVGACSNFADVKIEFVDFFADLTVEIVDFFGDKKICITNANELEEDLLRSLNLMD